MHLLEEEDDEDGALILIILYVVLNLYRSILMIMRIVAQADACSDIVETYEHTYTMRTVDTPGDMSSVVHNTSNNNKTICTHHKAQLPGSWPAPQDHTAVGEGCHLVYRPSACVSPLQRNRLQQPLEPEMFACGRDPVPRVQWYQSAQDSAALDEEECCILWEPRTWTNPRTVGSRIATSAYRLTHESAHPAEHEPMAKDHEETTVNDRKENQKPVEQTTYNKPGEPSSSTKMRVDPVSD